MNLKGSRASQSRLIQSDWDSVAAKVVPELATGGKAYDVVEFDNGWVAQWCGAGWVTPLNEYMSAGYTDGMIQGLTNLFTCPDGSLGGLVWNNDTRFFYYNSTKLTEAGFEAPPETWDELVAQSLAAQKAGVVDYGMAPPSGIRNGLSATSSISGPMPLAARLSMMRGASCSTRTRRPWPPWNS